MGIVSHGLSTLMEAVNLGQRADDKSETLYSLFEGAIDEDIINAVTGQEDTVDGDMDGEGVGDDEQMEELLSKIPPSDEMTEDEIENVTESFLPEL
jgi:hypothetical protein